MVRKTEADLTALIDVPGEGGSARALAGRMNTTEQKLDDARGALDRLRLVLVRGTVTTAAGLGGVRRTVGSVGLRAEPVAVTAARSSRSPTVFP